MEEKPIIYCVQSGLGKTYLCQHYPGWYDLDIFPFKGNLEIYKSILDFVVYWGYKVLTTATMGTITSIDQEKYRICIIAANQNRKDEILNGIKNRKVETKDKDSWAALYKKVWDSYYEWLNIYKNKKIYPNIDIVFLEKGKYLEDYLKENNLL